MAGKQLSQSHPMQLPCRRICSTGICCINGSLARSLRNLRPSIVRDGPHGNYLYAPSFGGSIHCQCQPKDFVKLCQTAGNWQNTCQGDLIRCCHIKRTLHVLSMSWEAKLPQQLITYKLATYCGADKYILAFSKGQTGARCRPSLCCLHMC